ncbi:MAG: hypothetical protein HOO90_03060 [Methylotenera sp.]|nr:hypothetical protein [Methylotenera sp.]NOU24497.1 hypothetical protein [Methylotenera sp.]
MNVEQTAGEIEFLTEIIKIFRGLSPQQQLEAIKDMDDLRSQFESNPPQP